MCKLFYSIKKEINISMLQLSKNLKDIYMLLIKHKLPSPPKMIIINKILQLQSLKIKFLKPTVVEIVS